MYDYNKLNPDYLREGMKRYLEYGILPGHFLRAIISNDLLNSVVRADEHSRENLHGIVMWMCNEVPIPSWGSEEKMHEWAQLKRSELLNGDDDGAATTPTDERPQPRR